MLMAIILTCDTDESGVGFQLRDRTSSLRVVNDYPREKATNNQLQDCFNATFLIRSKQQTWMSKRYCDADFIKRDLF